MAVSVSAHWTGMLCKVAARTPPIHHVDGFTLWSLLATAMLDDEHFRHTNTSSIARTQATLSMVAPRH